jgi:hypothetical protein
MEAAGRRQGFSFEAKKPQYLLMAYAYLSICYLLYVRTMVGPFSLGWTGQKESMGNWLGWGGGGVIRRQVSLRAEMPPASQYQGHVPPSTLLTAG